MIDKSHDQASNADNIKENKVSESGETESIISEDNNPALQAKDEESNGIEGTDGAVNGQADSGKRQNPPIQYFAAQIFLLVSKFKNSLKNHPHYLVL